MKETCYQKHLGILLNFKLDFQEHCKYLLKKVNKVVALLRKFQNILPRSALLTIYKCFLRTNLNYSNMIYDQAFNNFFHQKITSLQYNAALAISGAIFKIHSIHFAVVEKKLELLLIFSFHVPINMTKDQTS